MQPCNNNDHRLVKFRLFLREYHVPDWLGTHHVAQANLEFMI